MRCMGNPHASHIHPSTHSVCLASLACGGCDRRRQTSRSGGGLGADIMILGVQSDDEGLACDDADAGVAPFPPQVDALERQAAAVDAPRGKDEIFEGPVLGLGVASPAPQASDAGVPRRM